MTREAFLLLADPLPEPMLLLSSDGSILEANRATEDRLSVQAKQLRGHGLHDLVEESSEAVSQYLQTCSLSRNLVAHPLSFLGNHGEGISCRAEGALAVPPTQESPALLLLRLIPNETAIGQFGARQQRIEVLDDEIHRRKQAEEDLRDTEQRYRSLYNSMDEGFCIIEMIFDEGGKPVDYRFLDTNPAFEKQTGLIDARGKRIRELAPAHEQSWFDIYGKIALTGEPLRFENRASALGYWYDVYAFPIEMPGGRRVGIVFNDINRRKEAELALHEAHKLLADKARQLEQFVEQRTIKLQETIGELEAFSYTIAHDMRAPLRAMQNFSRILEEEHSHQLDAEAKTYLNRIARSSERLDRLIQDVLNFSKIVRADVRLEPVDTQALLDEIIHSYPNLHAARANITFAAPLPTVLGNRAAMTQVFSNLLGNAVKFVKPGVVPTIQIRAESNHKINGELRVRLWFEDNGIGIQKGSQERIFQMFQCLNQPGEFEGTGMGLAIVRKAVERMGGKTGVESEPGHGSRFWIELPQAPLNQHQGPKSQTDLS